MGLIADVQIAGDQEAWISTAVDTVLDHATEAIDQRGSFVLCLAGGSTPKQVYERLAADPRSRELDWTRITVLFGDERCVPPDDEQSNYKMAATSFLDPLGVPQASIERIRGEEPPERAAIDYASRLGEVLGGRPGGGRPPDRAIDLVLLGLGPNGHTASLFPGLTWTVRTQEWVLAEFVEVMASWRITLTPLVLCAARQIVFLVQGAAKAPIVAKVLSGPVEPIVLPAQAIVAEPPARWLLDDEAAAQL